METTEMITPDSCPSGLVLLESGSVELMPEKLGCSGLIFFFFCDVQI
jgi:hypothetical protein